MEQQSTQVLQKESDATIPDYLAEPKHALVKSWLVTAGKTLGGVGYHLQAALNYVLLGAWLREHGFSGGASVVDRPALFAYAASTLPRSRVLYLEFGVFMGASIQMWSRLLTDASNRFVGFDSFVGMPEDFDIRTGVLRGELNRNGQAPPITDPRVSFVKGWFTDTLPGYVVPEHERLVIHIDCDLYSATNTVFEYLNRYIVPGTVLLFDDMGSPFHEPRSFSEYMRSSGKRFKLIAHDREDHYAFACL